MRETPHYQEYKYAALGVAACSGPMKPFFTNYAQKQLPALETLYAGGVNAEPSFFSVLGDDTRSWSMDFVAERPEFSTPGNDYVEFIATLGESDPDLLPFVDITRSEYAGIPWVRGSIAASSSCQRLAARSRQALAALEKNR